MKSLCTAIALLLLTFTAAAQSAVYQVPVTEDFGTAASHAYKVDRTGAWERLGNRSGGYYLQTPDTGHGTAPSYTITFKVRTSDFENISVSWRELNLADGGNVNACTRTVSYRAGRAGAFTQVFAAAVTGNASWVDRAVSLAGVPAVNDQEHVEIQITVTKSTGNGSRLGIDNISVTGTFMESVEIAPLPVELASFQAQGHRNAVKLAWTTASEKNNDRFEVERSQDGKSFSRIGQVKGSGTSATGLAYSFTDNAPAAGLSYYRLRQVDYDGTESFSKVVAVAAAVASEASVYPTLASTVVTISLQPAGSQVSVSVVDASGRPVATFTNTQERSIELPVHSLKSGLYFVRIADGQGQQVRRFIRE